MRSPEEFLLNVRFRRSASSAKGLTFLNTLGAGTELSRFAAEFAIGEQKQTRFNISRELLRIRSAWIARQWHDIVTLDQLWFSFRSHHDVIWMAPGQIGFEREGPAIQPPGFVLTFVWNSSGFHILKTLIKRGKFNANYCAIKILVAITDWG
jgi:hypothetical protein